MKNRNYFIQQVILIMCASLLGILLITINAGKAQSQSRGGDRPVYRTEHFSLSTPAELKVESFGGSLEVRGGAGSDARVEVYVQENGDYKSSDEIKLEHHEISIRKEGRRIIAKAVKKGFWGSNNDISISFKVFVPRQTSTNLATGGGSVTLADLEGKQTLETGGGHINLSQIKGTIDAETSGGHITLEQVSGTVTAHTSGGHINANGLNGTVTLKTSGGHITLDEVSGTVSARTSGGHINADITEIGNHLKLSTSGGNVNVSVPSGIGLNLTLRGSMVRTDLENFSGITKPQKVEGTLNGGGPELTAKTSGGLVELRFR